jgi:membrane protein
LELAVLVGDIWQLIKDTYDKWSNDRAPQMAAAVAFYALFSLVPLLIVITTIASLSFGQAAANSQLTGEIRGLIGQSSTEFMQGLIRSAAKPSSGIAMTVGGVVLIFGSVAIFVQLQEALNVIWGVSSDQNRGLITMLKERSLAGLMVVLIGALTLSSIAIRTVLNAGGRYASQLLPGASSVWSLLDVPVSFALVFVLFALTYSVLPNAKIAWRDVWQGALVAALLFTIGRYAIAFYLGRAKIESSYGAAGSLVAIMLWVYYSAQILFFGAEFASVVSRRQRSNHALTS